MLTLFRGGRVIDPVNQLDQTMDLYVEDGRISRIAERLPVENGASVIDCKGWVVAPGLVDAHVHLREPGFVYKETIDTGTEAAACGGFTSVISMANLDPVPDNPVVYQAIEEMIRRQAHVRVYQAASVTKSLEGKRLADIRTLAELGVKVFSDDGRFLDTAQMLYQALLLSEKYGFVVSVHEEDTSLKEFSRTAYSHVVEECAIARDLEICAAAGGHLHLQHVSTARGVSLIRAAKQRGIAVTAEVTPHHLALTDEAVDRFGTNAKMSPPLRKAEDVEALIEGLIDGTIDIIATDHAPHAADEKARDYELAPNGIVGLETALGVACTELCHQRGRSLTFLLEKMSLAPARLFGLPAGTLSVGAAADLCLFDPNEEWMVRASQFASQGKNTPFEGMSLKGRVKMTVCGGKIVYRDPSQG